MSFVAPDDWAPSGVEYLEPNAWTALRTTDANVCVVASAGSGKTEFLAQKAAFLLQTGICRDPQRILAISFKRDAARNLSVRVRARCTPDYARRFDSMTFDAFTKGLVDRFGAALPAPHNPSANYRIVFPKPDDWNDFMNRNGVYGFNASALEKRLATTALPIQDAVLAQPMKNALELYWSEAYQDQNETRLAFPMLNRLAEFLIRTNPQIRRALRRTYPFVFLDEFQDTTVAQYELLQTLFDGANTKLTAVGDDKQRIMGWAGALNDGFQTFSADFGAQRITLLSNWRSHQDLVRIQHAIACRIDADADEPEARGDRRIEGDVSAVWEFATQETECQGIASWIAREINSEAFAAHEVAVLVRMRASQAEDELAPYFQARGIPLRNVARLIEGVAIQDLLAEEITEALLPLLRLGAQPKAPEAWSAAVELQQLLRGLDEVDDLADQKVRRDLEACVRDLRQQMNSTAPELADLETLLATALDFIDEPALRQSVPSYRRNIDYNRVLTAFKALLLECVTGAPNWTTVLARFEGIGQVPLMTIHKSKGLEFHTMIFMGLDNSSWWSLAPGQLEELKSFFVAFTRAKQRAFFTSCTERGQSIGWIDALVAPAGVVRIPGPT